MIRAIFLFVTYFVFSCIFTLLSRESDITRSLKTGILNLFCLVYPLPKYIEYRSIIYPQCTTTAFSILKIEVFLGL